MTVGMSRVEKSLPSHADPSPPLDAESVPSPRTRSQLLASTLEWCNLTLQCQGAGKGAVNVTWKKDNIIRDLTSDRHQLSPDGTTLRLALPPTAANVTYACTVSNPADQKVVLFDLQAICQSGGETLAPGMHRCLTSAGWFGTGGEGAQPLMGGWHCSLCLPRGTDVLLKVGVHRPDPHPAGSELGRSLLVLADE